MISIEYVVKVLFICGFSGLETMSKEEETCIALSYVREPTSYTYSLSQHEVVKTCQLDTEKC